MMLREFEVLIWATINNQEHVSEFINEKDAQKKLLYRLLMTAFFLKEKLSSPEELVGVKAFFTHHFPQFLGKYTTEWLLLAEPDLQKITPKVINSKLSELKDIYEKMQSIEKASGEEDDDDQNKDFNKIVEELGEEVSRIDQLKRQY